MKQENAEYLAKLDRGIKQVKSGNLKFHDLIETDENCDGEAGCIKENHQRINIKSNNPIPT